MTTINSLANELDKTTAEVKRTIGLRMGLRNDTELTPEQETQAREALTPTPEPEPTTTPASTRRTNWVVFLGLFAVVALIVGIIALRGPRQRTTREAEQFVEEATPEPTEELSAEETPADQQATEEPIDVDAIVNKILSEAPEGVDEEIVSDVVARVVDGFEARGLDPDQAEVAEAVFAWLVKSGAFCVARDLGPWAPSASGEGETFEVTASEHDADSAGVVLGLWWPHGRTDWGNREVTTFIPTGLSVTVINAGGRGWDYPAQWCPMETIEEQMADHMQDRSEDTAYHDFVDIDTLIEMGLIEVRFDRRAGN